MVLGIIPNTKFVYSLKSAAADCFFYLHTLFCIWIDSYFYCPIYFPHLIPTYEWFQSSFLNNMFSFYYYNTIPTREQAFSFSFIKFFWAFMLRSTIHLPPIEEGEFLLCYVKRTDCVISLCHLSKSPFRLNRPFRTLHSHPLWFWRKLPYNAALQDRYLLETVGCFLCWTK